MKLPINHLNLTAFSLLQRGSDGVICYVKDSGESEVHLGLIQPHMRRTVKIQDNVSYLL